MWVQDLELTLREENRSNVFAKEELTEMSGSVKDKFFAKRKKFVLHFIFVQALLEASASMAVAIECVQSDSQSEVRGFRSRLNLHS
jgi:hypothetical protein